MSSYPTIYDDDLSFRTNVGAEFDRRGYVVSVGEVTVASGTTTTDVDDEAILSDDVIMLIPKGSALAASALPYVSTVGDATFTLSHSNEATAREYFYSVLAAPGARL